MKIVLKILHESFSNKRRTEGNWWENVNRGSKGWH